MVDAAEGKNTATLASRGPIIPEKLQFFGRFASAAAKRPTAARLTTEKHSLILNKKPIHFKKII
jgi:hypothetical protein